MSDEPKVTISPPPDPPRYQDYRVSGKPWPNGEGYTFTVRAKNLTEGEQRALELKAAYRGKLGRLRSAVRDAIDQLPDGTPAKSILERALAEDEEAA